MSPLGSDRVSSSEDSSSEDSNSSSLTGSASPGSSTGQVPNSSIPNPQPVNQMPGNVLSGRDEPVEEEPGPYDLENETRDEWEERLREAGYFPLPTFYVLEIPSHVSKIALNKIRRRLPEGYTLLYEHNWPNIVEPHREDRIGFHTISLDAGIVFPLRPLLTEVLPGGTGCEGFVYFKGRTGRKFISEVPQSNRGWKEKFVFIEFPPFVTPLAGLKWNDHLLNQEYAAPASAPDLEASLEVLMRGDPFTGRVFHYGSWVWRVESGGEGTSQAHEAAGRGVPSPGNTAEAEGQNHPDMEFEEYAMPEDKPEGETGGSQTGTTKTFTVQPETVEVHDLDDEPHPDRSKGAGKEKTSRRQKKTIEEAFVNLGLRLKEKGEIGPHTVEQLGMGSLRGGPVETFQLKEENSRLMDEVSETRKEMALKEENFPGRAAAWVGENKAEAARVMTASPEDTVESFKLLYREPEGRKMITKIGSFGFKCSQKKDRTASHRVLLKRDPEFTAASYGLAPIPEEEPTPPFPLD
ncbi:unnamed protein product [Cuscuta campestris]|uniref:Uncharacterized protein n=1 Tax=Cuscuta campestris TaxID=132261 RepID=A0A484KYY3_9ASTE|nr:unnamed protein product [Cuscuta campestris]